MSISVSDACATCGDPTGIDPFSATGALGKYIVLTGVVGVQEESSMGTTLPLTNCF